MKTLSALILGTSLLIPAGMFAQTAYTEGPVNIPGSFMPQAYGIDDDDQVAGFYYDSQGYPHGFVLTLGVIGQIDQPGALNSTAFGIHSTAGIVGTWSNTQGTEYGLLDAGRHIKTIAGSRGKSVSAINAGGSFVGQDQRTGKGFLNVNGVYSNVDPAVCKSLPAPVSVFVNGINSNGDLVGYCYGGGGTSAGFARVGGVYQTVTVFGSATFPTGINDAGTIAGWFDNGSSFLHGFLLSGGTATQFDYVGPHSTMTKIFAVNNRGSVAGVAFDNTVGEWLGFYAFAN
jgi:hypothetical protein